MKGESLESGDTASKTLVQQNIELRRKLEEEHSSYKRKLQAYQDGQQRQAQLVQKLQAKVTDDWTFYGFILESVADNTFFFEFSEKIRFDISDDSHERLLASVAQLDVHSTGDHEVGFPPPSGRQHYFVEIDHEIFSMAILSLPLI